MSDDQKRIEVSPDDVLATAEDWAEDRRRNARAIRARESISPWGRFDPPSLDVQIDRILRDQ